MVALLLALTVAAPAAGPAPSLGDAWAETTPGRVAGHSLEGRPIVYHDLGEGPDTTLIIATIHGDEWAGTPLVEELLRRLRAHPQALARRRVVVVPNANPDGFIDQTRGNLRGIDLNRNFPAANFVRSRTNGPAPLSEPESRVLERLVRRLRPDRIVSIHQPLRRIDHDGPARELARAMGRTAPLPVRRIGGRPGSLGSWVGGALGIPIVTLELPWRAERRSTPWLWSRYGPSLLTAIGFGEGPQALTATR